MTRTLVSLVLLAAGAAAEPSRPPHDSYVVDPSHSHVLIHVGKAGALSFFAGHTHEVIGRIAHGTVDIDRSDLSRSRVHLVVPTASLKVSPEGEPPNDVPKVQETMASGKVLAVDQYPEVTFDTTSVTGPLNGESTSELTVAGRLTIRGVTRPVTARVHMSVADGTLKASGRFSFKQSAYGITPIKVAGVVAVKDTLDVDFSLAAHRQ